MPNLPPTTGAPLNLYVPAFDYGINPGDDTWDVVANANWTALNNFAQTVILFAPTTSQTVVQPAATYFNFNFPLVYGAQPAILFGVAAGAFDSAFTRTAAGTFTLDSNAAGNAGGSLSLTGLTASGEVAAALVNAVTGFQVGGTAPNNHILVGNGSEYVGSATLPTGLANYQTVQAAGASVAQRAKLNFLAPLTVTDDSSNGSTDIGITLPAPGTPSQTNYGSSGTGGRTLNGSPIQNTSGKLMAVNVTGFSSSATLTAFVGATSGAVAACALQSFSATGGGGHLEVSFFVLPGFWYQVQTDDAALTYWVETILA